MDMTIHDSLDKAFKAAQTNLNQLKKVVDESNKKQLNERYDDLFTKDNVNFFTNLYLISACSYVENFLKEILRCIIHEFIKRINSSNLSHHFVYWLFEQKPICNNNYETPFKSYQISISENDGELKDNEKSTDNFNNKLKQLTEISANPYKTIKAFEKLGINLKDEPEFTSKKEKIRTIVDKRNNIIHYADYYSNDISLKDISDYIDDCIEYIEAIIIITKKYYP